MAVRDIEVLFEYLEYRTIICCKRNDICEEVEHHLALAGQLNERRVIVLSRSKPKTQPNNGYILQKWVPRWGCFVNVESVNDINAEDRITVAKLNSEISEVSWLCSLSY